MRVTAICHYSDNSSHVVAGVAQHQSHPTFHSDVHGNHDMLLLHRRGYPFSTGTHGHVVPNISDAFLAGHKEGASRSCGQAFKQLQTEPHASVAAGAQLGPVATEEGGQTGAGAACSVGLPQGAEVGHSVIVVLQQQALQRGLGAPCQLLVVPQGGEADGGAGRRPHGQRQWVLGRPGAGQASTLFSLHESTRPLRTPAAHGGRGSPLLLRPPAWRQLTRSFSIALLRVAAPGPARQSC